MVNEILARPLVRLAEHKFACVRAARNSLVNNSRRHTSGSHYSTPAFIPDFLLPAFMIGKPVATPSFHAFPPPRQPKYLNTSHTRHISASPATLATVVTANSRKDEDGNEMLIEITARAATRLKEIMSKDSNPSLALRVTVESGGCHGFQYLMSLTNTSAISAEDDTVFEASDGSGAKVIMDEPSLELLKGSKVDFTTELIGSQFKIVGNPAATSSCGCGTSFDIKP
ncbi:hypothetical protein ABVK25_002108 [Lepraria finkii]|uniref:Core domain-containing protein n=1 Tax=Lepraria finkii TaxID=1340010 RepID=A0ABR4BLS4_9LECA